MEKRVEFSSHHPFAVMRRKTQVEDPATTGQPGVLRRLPTDVLAVLLCRVLRNQSFQKVLREPLYLIPVGVNVIA
jgi:hypothetical protein